MRGTSPVNTTDSMTARASDELQEITKHWLRGGVQLGVQLKGCIWFQPKWYHVDCRSWHAT
eukprot:366558-Chlamydomonas_euryale.AAC.26